MYYTNNTSFQRKSHDRSVENTSGADDRAAEYLGQISFELLRKYFDKKSKTQNKSMEAKLHSDARQTEKNLKPNQSEKSTSNSKVTKYNIISILNWSKI